MKNINPEIKEQILIELTLLGYKYRNNMLEWGNVTHILEHEILPFVFDLFENKIDNLNQKQQRLQAKINQLKFSNDPERDRRIVELFNLGLSRGSIAKDLGMSKWGVSKALRRLGVN